ncbi:MAG: helix-turn-helix transcriptional regulator [Pseudomonadota bacterium]
MPDTRHRGPRLVPAQPLTTEPGRRVLMPELLGRVLATIRRSLDVSQKEVADWLYMPASTVSKLELGSIHAAVHHLDALAAAFSFFEERDRGGEAPGWQGWELHRMATRIADALGEQGYTVLWADMEAGAEAGADARLYCRGRRLAALVRDCWPGRGE